MSEKLDNEIIAEFMGECISIVTSDGTVFLRRPKGFVDQEAKYHKSWSELHPVWDKWRRVAKGYSGYHGWVAGLKESFMMCKVKSACKQMAKAIRWYNSQKHLTP